MKFVPFLVLLSVLLRTGVVPGLPAEDGYSSGVVEGPLPRAGRPYIAPLMEHNAEFEWEALPLREWLAAEKTEDIPWKVDVENAALRMDQRMEVSYSAAIRAKDLNKLGEAHQLVFLSGVSRPDGEWLTPVKVVRYDIEKKLLDEDEVHFTDAAFLQPGDYFLWFVLYDIETSRRSVEKRDITVPKFDNDVLLHAADSLPAAEIPALSDREGRSLLEHYLGLSLPAANKQPLKVELLAVLSAPAQWAGQHEVVRTHNEYVAGALNTLSQIKLSPGSTMSLTALDILQRRIVFQEKNTTPLDWVGLGEAFKKVDNDSVNVATLQAKGVGGFFRESVDRALAEPRDRMRVVIVVSSSFVFAPGSDKDPIELTGDCHCRFYHLRFRHAPQDAFDDLGRILRPLRPKTFNLSNPKDFRRALAEIMKDLGDL